MASFAQRRAAARARLQRSRTGRAFLGIGGRAGQIALPTAAGVLAQFAGEMAQDKIGFLQGKWWGVPGAQLAAAIIMLRRKPNVAFALAGCAGQSAAFNYKLNQFQQGKRSTSPVPLFTGGAPAPPLQLVQPVKTTAYYDDASAIEDAIGF